MQKKWGKWRFWSDIKDWRKRGWHIRFFKLTDKGCWVDVLGVLRGRALWLETPWGEIALMHVTGVE